MGIDTVGNVNNYRLMTWSQGAPVAPQPAAYTPVYQPSVYQPSAYTPAQPAYTPVQQPGLAPDVNVMIQQLTSQLQSLQTQLDSVLHGQLTPNGVVSVPVAPPPPPPPPAPVPLPPAAPVLPPAPVYQPSYPQQPYTPVQQPQPWGQNQNPYGQQQPYPQQQPYTPVQQPQPWGQRPRRRDQNPVVQPQPVVQPTPAPAQPQTAAINLPGVSAGETFAVDNGTVLHGYSVGGTGRVNQFDGKVLDMTVDATAMMGMVHMQLNLHGEVQPDGRLHLTASKADGGKMFDETLNVTSNQPGNISLASTDGQQSSISTDGRGGITIRHGQDLLRLHRA